MPGMDNQRGFHDCEAIVDRAAAPLRHGEEIAVGVCRAIVRDHERDPGDGTVRPFGGRDRNRLISALMRVPAGERSPAALRGRLEADVAVQRIARRRADALHRGLSAPTSVDARDLRALGGGAGPLVAETSLSVVEAAASGRFATLPDAVRDWVVDSVAHAGRRAEVERMAPPVRDVASIAAARGLLAQAGLLPLPDAGPTRGMDGSGRPDLDDLHAATDALRARRAVAR